MEGVLDFSSTEVRHGLFESRLARSREAMITCGVEVLLITDPINIQYVTGATNMTVFSTRTPARYLLLFANGPAILFEFAGSEHVALSLPTIDVVRSARGLCFISSNGAVVEESTALAREIAGLVIDECGHIERLAIDRFRFETADALRAVGFVLADADPILSHARQVKLPLEIDFMREALRRVEVATKQFELSLRPGITEAQAWSEFHAPFIALNGQYVVSRLMQSGSRTFPYFNECGDGLIEAGDLVCLDTDAIGFEGYAVDFSRTFLVGTGRATAAQRLLYSRALEQLQHNSALIGPGVSFEDVARKAWVVPAEHRTSRYYCIGHGLGMSGEFPNLPYASPGEPYQVQGGFEPGMVFCVESYVGSEDAGQGVKLENQLLITEQGVEVMSGYPLEPRLE